MWGSICSGGRLWLRPVELGQTRYAFYVSAILIALWLLTRPATAEAGYIRGSSEDQYLRAEWMYNLEEGYGFLSLKGKTPVSGDPMTVGLRGLSFQTRGIPFTTVGGGIGGILPSPELIPVPGSPPLYGYSTLASVASAVCLPSVALFTFPRQGISLYQTTLEYTAHLAPTCSGAIPVAMFSDVLSFVSVQTIPEPSTAVTAVGAAALVVGTGWRLGRRKDESSEGHARQA
jgi:hypothetical protein